MNPWSKLFLKLLRLILNNNGTKENQTKKEKQEKLKLIPVRKPANADSNILIIMIDRYTKLIKYFVMFILFGTWIFLSKL